MQGAIEYDAITTRVDSLLLQQWQSNPTTRVSVVLHVDRISPERERERVA